jgi:hypothetical protein
MDDEEDFGLYEFLTWYNDIGLPEQITSQITDVIKRWMENLQDTHLMPEEYAKRLYNARYRRIHDEAVILYESTGGICPVVLGTESEFVRFLIEKCRIRKSFIIEKRIRQLGAMIDDEVRDIRSGSCEDRHESQRILLSMMRTEGKYLVEHRE